MSQLFKATNDVIVFEKQTNKTREQSNSPPKIIKQELIQTNILYHQECVEVGLKTEHNTEKASEPQQRLFSTDGQWRENDHSKCNMTNDWHKYLIQ